MKTNSFIPTVCFDFDGVINSYKGGWQGVDVINDPPVDGIKESIDEVKAAGYRVVVNSTRTATPKGLAAVKAYLDKHNIVVDDVVSEKPVAFVYIDDRAIQFDGRADTLLTKIQNFKPWNK